MTLGAKLPTHYHCWPIALNKISLSELSDAHRELTVAAQRCCENAYAPYSKFHVGAALLAKSGDFFTGVNVENSSFGLTICAERIALGAAVTAGEREFDAIAIATPGGHMPCGACRQMLAEFGDMQILAIDSGSDLVKTTRLRELLPMAFEFGDRS